MQYPVCIKEAKFELVAIANRYPKDTTGFYLKWRLNDGHTVDSLDMIKPTVVGQLLVQPYGEDRNRFIVSPAEAGTYDFKLQDNRLPFPEIVFSKRHLKAGETNLLVVINDDTSADITLVCDNNKVQIEESVNGKYSIKIPLTEADKVVTLTATANYNDRVYNSVSKDVYIAEARPKAPIIKISKQGTRAQALSFQVEDSDTEIVTKVYATDGKIQHSSGSTWTLTKQDAGIVKVMAFSMRESGITSDIVEAEVSIF